MSKSPDTRRLKSLHQLAKLKSDLALAALSSARLACEQTAARIEGLTCPILPRFEGENAATLEQQRLLYESWAEQRRIALNGLLARQMVEAAERLTEAREAFGRADVVEKLCQGPALRKGADPG